MKNLKKYLGILAVLLVVPACANAEITVKDTVSPEFIRNQGYSEEVNRVIKVKTIHPNTPLAAPEEHSTAKKFGWYLRKTIDPAAARPNEFVNHDIKQGSSIEDL